MKKQWIGSLIGALLVTLGGGLLTFVLLSNDGKEKLSSTTETTSPRLVTIAYLTLSNTASQADALISAETPLAQNVVIAQREVQLPPNERVALSLDTQYLSLLGLQQDLYRGDTVPMTLRFKSGLELAIELAVLDEAPNDDIELQQFTVGNLVVENAWTVATQHGTNNQTKGYEVVQTTYEWELPSGFPIPVVPEDNPMTAEKVELGRFLFYETRLSGNSTMSCSSCHEQALAFTDGLSVPVGSTGESHIRNSQTLTNIAYNSTYTWANPILTEVEQQIVIPLFGEFPVEMGITGNEEVVLQRLRDDAEYQRLFASAFPSEAEPINFHHLVQALSSFVRTLISGNSPYDRYVYQGDRTTLSESALRGMNLFLGERFECHHCHGGFNFTASAIHANSTFIERPFFNTGLFNIDGTGSYPRGNRGIFEITSKPEDMGRFRPPTLRNIELTAPYMHDGSFATLEEVIRFYADGGRVISEGDYAGDGRGNPYKSTLVPGFEITDQEMIDLINFLKSLTDEQFINDPRFNNPFEE